MLKSLLSYLWHGSQRSQQRATKISLVPPRDPAIKEIFGLGGEDTAGVPVDENTAKTFSAFNSAVNLISSTIGMLTCYKYEKSKLDLKISTGTLNTMVSESPNDFMSAGAFQTLLTNHALSWGNGYAEIIRATEGGQPVALDPIHPSKVKTIFDESGDKVHLVDEGEKDEQGNVKERVIKDADMFHLFGISEDGCKGDSIVRQAERSLSVCIASETFAASFYKNGATTSGVITHPLDLGKDGAKRLESKINEKIQGVRRAHRLLVLDEGMKFQQTSIPPDDAQFLESRQFQVVEIARWFRIPPHMLYDMNGATFSNIEQQNLEFMTYTIAPWLKRWTAEYKRKLIGVDPTGDNFFGFDTSEIQTSDMKTRFDAYGVARNGGWYTLNDIFRREKMPLLPPEIGDTHLAPSTMKTLEQTDGKPGVDMTAASAIAQFIHDNGPVTSEAAKALVKGALPTAEDSFVKALVDTLMASGKVRDNAPLANQTPNRNRP